MKIDDRDSSKTYLKNKSMIDTFNNAINGLLTAVRSERNIKIHLVAAIMVIGTTLVLNFSRMELAILAICIILVFVAEFFNTALEEVVDMMTQGRYSKVAKRVKDIAAGAVFVTAINAMLVGYLLIYEKIKGLVKGGRIALSRIFANPSHLIFIALALVLISVILLKGLFYKKNTSHLQGGTVSGHSALAFNMATIGAVLTKRFEVVLILYFIAFLVAESRVEGKIHTLREVVFGAILGTAIALLLFIGYY